MTEPGMTEPRIPTFFSERAFDVVRPEASAISYDPEAWLAVSGLAQSLVRNGLPPLHSSSIVFRYAVPGLGQPRDPSIENVDEFNPVFYADHSLTTPATAVPERIARNVILGVGAEGGRLKPFEITINSSDLVGGLIRTLAEPPVDEQKLFASPSAWMRVLTAPSQARQKEFAGRVREHFAHVIQKVPKAE